ncbi:MAG: hypothetical protein M3O77_00035 [Chloroflexota bacterium]|nr:hypothetical protein [Chloroflexota bacterium]
MLPLIWTIFAVSSVAGFIVIAAYWLDVQDRADLTRRRRIGWSAAVLIFPISIPVYAFFGGPAWPRFLRAASFIPVLALALFFGFVLGLFA